MCCRHLFSFVPSIFRHLAIANQNQWSVKMIHSWSFSSNRRSANYYSCRCSLMQVKLWTFTDSASSFFCAEILQLMHRGIVSIQSIFRRFSCSIALCYRFRPLFLGWNVWELVAGHSQCINYDELILSAWLCVFGSVLSVPHILIKSNSMKLSKIISFLSVIMFLMHWDETDCDC